MPRNRFAFSIKVGREPDLVGILGEFAEFRDDLFGVGRHFVGRCEIVLDVHPGYGILDAFGVPLRQVANMTDRGLHRPSIAEIALDGLGLGRTFHNDEIGSHG